MQASTAALIALILAGCWVRAAGLPAVQGTMGRDEARLALAARGILAHGLPILPDGFLYTRGLLPAYLEAMAFAVFGISDQAARLSSLVFGSLTILAVYRLGRLAGGDGPALAAATIVAFAQPLVLQSREAWLYSSFLFWLLLSVGWLVRDAPGDRARAGGAAWAALFSHELAVLLIPIAAGLDLGRLWLAWRGHRSPVTVAFSGPGFAGDRGSGSRSRREKVGVRGLIVFWGMLLAGVGVVGALALALRAPTAGGSTVEMREYLRPALDLVGLSATLGILTGWNRWLLPLAALGLPLSRSTWRAALAARGAAPSLLVVLVVIVFNAFGLVRRGESRYVLAALPFLAVAAATALARLGPLLLTTLVGWQRINRERRLLRTLLLVVLVGVSVDPARLIADARAHDVSSTWVQAVADRGPSDLIVSFAPTLTSHYLGRTDFWLRSDDYAKYVWAGQTPLRDVHTGAVVIRDRRDLDQLLLAPHPGQTVWVILDGDPAAEGSRASREVALALASLAIETRRPPDGRVVLRIQL
jgi:hypothetical protein